LIVQFGRFGDRFTDKYPLNVVFEDASGLIKGSEVRMGGAMIGEVATRPGLDETLKVRTELRIDDRVRIPVGSKFQIASATLLGDKLVVVTPPAESGNEFIEPGSVVTGAGPSGLDAIQSRAEEFSDSARKLMDKAETTLTKLDGAVDDVRVATQELTQSIQKINTSVLSEENLAKFDASLANIEAATAEFSKAGKQLEPTLTEAREAIAEVKGAAKEANNTLAKASVRIDELGPALRDVPQAVKSISHAADQAGQALARVQDEDGLLGTLAYDREVSTDAKSFVSNLRRYGILRYRNADAKPEPDPRDDRFRGRRR
jgi:phospholipid/cholesterol/gamma-HCH transport system substrate-binding protein